MPRRARSAHGLLASLVAILMATGIFILAAPVAAQDEEVTANIDELDGSGVTGTAVLTAEGDQTKIVVDLDGAKKGYEGHAFNSTCDDHKSATVFHALDAVDADGHSETVVDAPFSELTSGDYWIHIHRSAEEGGDGVACGKVPAYGTGGSLPATGVGPLGGGQSDAWLLAGFVAAAAFGASWLLRRRGTARI